MEWTYVALLQMLLITAGVCTAMWMHVRSFKSQNEELRTLLEDADQRVKKAENPRRTCRKAPSPGNG